MAAQLVVVVVVIALELLPLGLVTFHVWQSGNAMPLKGDNHRFLIRTQNRGTGFRRTGLAIFHCLALAPFDNRLDVDAKFPAQRRVRNSRFSEIVTQSPTSQRIAVCVLGWRGSDRSPFARCGPLLSMVAPVFSFDHCPTGVCLQTTKAVNRYMGSGPA